jgi:hypothetical protein
LKIIPLPFRKWVGNFPIRGQGKFLMRDIVNVYNRYVW